MTALLHLCYIFVTLFITSLLHILCHFVRFSFSGILSGWDTGFHIEFLLQTYPIWMISEYLDSCYVDDDLRHISVCCYLLSFSESPEMYQVWLPVNCSWHWILFPQLTLDLKFKSTEGTVFKFNVRSSLLEVILGTSLEIQKRITSNNRLKCASDHHQHGGRGQAKVDVHIWLKFDKYLISN